MVLAAMARLVKPKARSTVSKNKHGRRERIKGAAEALHGTKAYHNAVAASRELRAQTEAQGHYILQIQKKWLTFGIGPAGTGKTYVCAALAAQALLEGKTERLIVTRPAVEACESLGFLPGELDQKFDPYFAPFRDVLDEWLGKSHVDGMIRSGKIVATPMAYMRGKTFKNAYVILDEAQNTTPNQMKLFLTRIGEDTKVVVNGDLAQSDLRGRNGLEDAIERLQHIEMVGISRFSRDDIVRSGLVRAVLEAYEP